MIRVVIENALRVELKLSVESEKAEEERQRPTQRVDGRERESSIDQSAISNAELLMAYRFIADGKSRPACYITWDAT